MRPLVATAALAALPALAALAACDPDEDPTRPSYDRCAAGDPCGLGTRCIPAGWTTADAAASLCSVECAVDRDCPGFAARCVRPPDDAGRAMCHRECASSADCRPGTACHAVPAGDASARVCVPDTGPRRCRVDLDCAPFVDRCALADAGGARDAAAGLCVVALDAGP